MILISYGAVTERFKVMAGLIKKMKSIKNGEIEQTRVDCYEFEYFTDLLEKFKNKGINVPKDIEIFCPSDNYPPHVDSGGTSYFIPLEKGNFYIDGINYPVVPFVLYSFDDGEPHNTDFCSIMLK